MQQKKQYSLQEKHQHVENWRASGLTRQQYCDLHAISFHSMRKWPQGRAEAQSRTNESGLLPVHIATHPVAALTPQALSEPVMFFLPGGIRMTCQPSQLTDVFRALKHADA